MVFVVAAAWVEDLDALRKLSEGLSLDCDPEIVILPL
jgi:hypothetical protein